MYLVGFVSLWWLAKIRARQKHFVVEPQQVGDIVFYAMLGVVLGGRIGYIVFYNLPEFFANPLILFKIWQGGMSFHGGLLGVFIAMWLCQRRHGWGFVRTMDFVAPMVPIGLGAGRIGNFINGELWGKVTDSPLGFLVNGEVRHASQLYEAFLEGIVLFAALWWFSARPRPMMAVSGLFQSN